MRDFSNLDGEVIEYEVIGGGSDVKKNYKTEFFADANGSESDYYNSTGVVNTTRSNVKNVEDPYARFEDLPSWSNADGEYSEARGRRRGRLARGIRQTFSEKNVRGTVLDPEERMRRRERKEMIRDERRSERFARRGERSSARAQGKLAKAEAKRISAEAQKAAAESLGRDSQADILLAQSLNQPTAQRQGVTNTSKIGWVILALAVVGVGAYFVIKSRQTATATATGGAK